VLFAIHNSFAHSPDDVVGFAHANPHLAALVAHHHHGPEAQLFAALNYFGDAPDLDDPLLTLASLLFAALFASATFSLLSHMPSPQGLEL
jgi:hypothetical protein